MLQTPSVRTVAVVVTAGAVLVAGLLVGVWLLVDPGSAGAGTQLELVRIGLTVLLGSGGLFGLWLAWRRQRSTEIALAQKQQDQADVARAYELQREDSLAKRITELYTKAAEQLGSDKAPVRLAGLYALERLAQDHPEQRQTIVNVLCAYLRMPYTLPGDPPAADSDTEVVTLHRERVQEREVRLTAQRVLAHHLRWGDNPESPVSTFWADIDLDLTAATLIDLDLDRTTIHTARFDGAQFNGQAWFYMARFNGHARFLNARFNCDPQFVGTQFYGDAWFHEAHFSGSSKFVALFVGETRFDEALFVGDTKFDGTRFEGKTKFHGAQFSGDIPREIQSYWGRDHDGPSPHDAPVDPDSVN